MPKIWILNTQEVKSDHALSNKLNSSISSISAINEMKYIWNIAESDICIVPFNVEPALLSYINKVKKLNNSVKIITVETNSKSRFLVDSIIQNQDLLASFKKLGQSNDWQLEPYMQTKRIVELANLTGISFQQTDQNLILNGLTEDLNCKAYFKSLCEKINLNTPPGLVFNNIDKLFSYLQNLKAKGYPHILLKKARASGGFGNLTGNKKNILKTIPNWLGANEKIIVEDYISFEKFVGTLMVIYDKEIKFISANQQIFQGHIWKGLQYPLTNEPLLPLIKKQSLALARLAQQKGARGWFNIDFGIQHHTRELFGLEINFRYCASSVLINAFAQPDRYLLYYNDFKTNHKSCTNILNDLAKLTIAGKSILANDITDQEGVVLIAVSPDSSSYGALIFSPKKSYITKVRCILKKYGIDNDKMS